MKKLSGAKRVLAVLVLCLGWTGPAVVAAATFDFANLTYDGSGTALSDFAGFKPTSGTFCTGGDLCSSNVNGGVLGGNLSYQSGGITVLATGFYNGGTASVVQDHDNGYNGLLFGSTANGAGLGVYHRVNPTDNSDDNITAGEMLKLSFDQVVTLSDVGMRAEGHNTTSWLTNASFEYSTNGTTWISALLPDNNVVGNANAGRFVLGLTGQDFYFRYGGTSPIDQFYISSVTVAAVPEPEIYALMGLGLGLMGFMARRRKSCLRQSEFHSEEVSQ